MTATDDDVGTSPPRSPLEGRLVRLRPPEESDADALNHLFGDPDVLAGLSFAFPQSKTGFVEFIRSSRGSATQMVFTIETLGGEPLGTCDLRDMEPRARSASAGIWIAKHAWGRGYGTDAMRVLCRFGFRQANLQRIGLLVYETNPAAIRSYEKVGFLREGTLRRAQFQGGRYIDVHVMGLLAEELVEE
jgi:RimJ/RimL family protein N-acetyltransferase